MFVIYVWSSMLMYCHMFRTDISERCVCVCLCVCEFAML